MADADRQLQREWVAATPGQVAANIRAGYWTEQDWRRQSGWAPELPPEHSAYVVHPNVSYPYEPEGPAAQA